MAYIVSDDVQRKLAALLEKPAVQTALENIEKDQENSLEEQIRLTCVEAPTYQEQQRAELFKQLLEELGLEDVRIDRGGNVLGLRRGTKPGKKVLVEAHMDTVFPMGSVQGVRRENGCLFAPGISDDTRGLAVILGVIRALNGADITTCSDILFAGTTREEGGGAMGGMKDLLDDMGGDIACVLSVDSASIENIIYCATGLRTMEFTFRGIGGHAYSAFGDVAQPVHAAARAAAKIAAMEVPKDPKTTFAVSNFHAGNMSGMHAIPAECSIVVNYRSNDPRVLEKLHERIFAIVQQACDEETARWGKDTITWSHRCHCDVPAGSQDVHAELVEELAAVIRLMGREPNFLPGGATNCNISIARGIPSVCMGFGWVREGETTKDHTLDERFPVENAFKGVQTALLMTLFAAGM